MTAGHVSRQCSRKHHDDCNDEDCECSHHPGGVIDIPDDAFTAVAEPSPPPEPTREPEPEVAAPVREKKPPKAPTREPEPEVATPAPNFEVFTKEGAKPPRANRLAERGLDPKKARAWAVANDIEVPSRGPLSVLAMDAYIAAVDAGTVEMSDSADEPAGPDVADVASSPLRSVDALVWRVACAVGGTCTWCRERQPDRDAAVDLGRAHIAEKHPGVAWEFRVQGIRSDDVVEDEVVAPPASVASEIADMLGSSPANFVESIGEAVELLAGALTPEDLVAILTSVDRTLWLLVEAHGRMPS